MSRRYCAGGHSVHRLPISGRIRSRHDRWEASGTRSLFTVPFAFLIICPDRVARLGLLQPISLSAILDGASASFEDFNPDFMVFHHRGRVGPSRIPLARICLAASTLVSLTPSLEIDRLSRAERALLDGV